MSMPRTALLFYLLVEWFERTYSAVGMILKRKEFLEEGA